MAKRLASARILYSWDDQNKTIMAETGKSYSEVVKESIAPVPRQDGCGLGAVDGATPKCTGVPGQEVDSAVLVLVVV